MREVREEEVQKRKNPCPVTNDGPKQMKNGRKVEPASHSKGLKGEAGWLAEKGLVRLDLAGCVRALRRGRAFEVFQSLILMQRRKGSEVVW